MRLADSIRDVRSRIDALVRSTPRDELEQTVALMWATMPSAPDLEDAGREAAALLPRRWQLPQGGIRYHESQAQARASTARHRCIEAGRRSGKSEDRKREIVLRALDPTWTLPDRWIVVGAPTQDQTEELYWDDLLALIPPKFITRVRRSRPRVIELVTGAKIKLAGMDRPARAEGTPIDDLFLDEFADMKSEVWDSHLSWSLSTPGRPPGRVTFYGTPDLRSGAHFVDLCDTARRLQESGDPDWSYHHWSSRGIVRDEEWETKRRDMNPAQFAVEFEALRVSTGSICYPDFDRDVHVRKLRYQPGRPVVVTFDWNWDPGTACVLQEQSTGFYADGDSRIPANTRPTFTAVLREVFIRQTNSEKVAEKVAEVIKELGHTGDVLLYGDPAGGAGGSSAVKGSDIDLVRKVMRPLFGDRLKLRFGRSAPRQKARVNSMNQRFRVGSGDVEMVSMLVDPSCRELIRDFEMVQWKKGASYDIEKKTDETGKLRTHLSDGLGYYVHEVFPVAGKSFHDHVKGATAEVPMNPRMR